MAPPPSTVNRSCVYVVRTPGGRFYCGQSDDIKGARMLSAPQLALPAPLLKSMQYS